MNTMGKLILGFLFLISAFGTVRLAAAGDEANPVDRKTVQVQRAR